MIRQPLFKLEKLREVRIASQKEVRLIADFMGITTTYYWQIENGRRRLTYPLAVSIAKFFDMKPDELFYEDHINKLK